MKAFKAISLLLAVASFFCVAAGLPPRQKKSNEPTTTSAEPKPAAAKRPSPWLNQPADGLRGKLLAHAAKDVGVREKRGDNDGPRIEQIQRAAGAEKGDPYCAAAVFAWGAEALGAGNPFPRSAWSPDFVSHPTWLKGRGVQPRGGDVFGIWFSSKQRVAHCGLVERLEGQYIITVEANTGPDGSIGEADRNGDGDGIRRKRRLASQIYAVKSWLP